MEAVSDVHDHQDDDASIFTLGDLAGDAVKEKRPICAKCDRPEKTCWCSYLPKNRIDCTTKIFILQHPTERDRRLTTARILQYGLAEGRCEIIRSKKYNEQRDPALFELLQAKNSLLLYPGENAVPLDSINPDQNYNLFILDGTWSEAKTMYNRNPVLKNMKSVKLPDGEQISAFVIKMQPQDGCLSTLECAAVAIATLEKNPSIVEPLTAPLRALCQFQLDHGGKVRQSKQWLKDNGLYRKQGLNVTR